jgi:hypothetical protein
MSDLQDRILAGTATNADAQELAEANELLQADLARLTREKETCPICGHLWRQHDPEDGKCDAHSAEGIGVCKCGRSIEFHQRKHADLSRRFLSVDDLSERLDTPRISTFVSVGADDDDGGRDAR